MKEDIIPFGDSALIVRFKGKNLESIKRAKKTVELLIREKIKGIIDFIPAIHSLTIVFDPLVVSFEDLKKRIEKLLLVDTHVKLPPPRTFKIPVVYGGRFGPDLKFVAEFNGITEEEVIKIHSEKTYRVYMVGFIPGFAYLGEVSKRIETPRLKAPRTSVPKGSVGIGGSFTGIYPVSSPGGWRIIGMTYFTPFNPEKIPPVEFDILDKVKFERVSEDEFLSRYRGNIEFIGGSSD